MAKGVAKIDLITWVVIGILVIILIRGFDWDQLFGWDTD